jgi:hypothetical protein
MSAWWAWIHNRIASSPCFLLGRDSYLVAAGHGKYTRTRKTIQILGGSSRVGVRCGRGHAYQEIWSGGIAANSSMERPNGPLLGVLTG